MLFCALLCSVHPMKRPTWASDHNHEVCVSTNKVLQMTTSGMICTLHAFIQAFQHTDPYTTGELPLKFIKKKRIHRLKTPQLQTSEVNNQQTQGCNNIIF